MVNGGENQELSLEMLELHRLTMRGIAALIANAPGYCARTTPNSALLLSGESVLDLNMIIVGPDREPLRFLEEAVALARRRRLPAIVMLSPDIAVTLASTAGQLGLTPAGQMPLMSLHATAPIHSNLQLEVDRVVDSRTSALAGDVQSTAFELPRENVRRALDAGRNFAPGQNTYVATFDGKAVAALTVIEMESSAGVWTMATLPEFQRRGIGRALLTRVLEQHRQAGIGRFFLCASEAGRRLYQSIGFRVVGDYTLWLLHE
jgi:N-acetylglutamate synthase